MAWNFALFGSKSKSRPAHLVDCSAEVSQEDVDAWHKSDVSGIRLHQPAKLNRLCCRCHSCCLGIKVLGAPLHRFCCSDCEYSYSRSRKDIYKVVSADQRRCQQHASIRDQCKRTHPPHPPKSPHVKDRRCGVKAWKCNNAAELGNIEGVQ